MKGCRRAKDRRTPPQPPFGGETFRRLARIARRRFDQREVCISDRYSRSFDGLGPTADVEGEAGEQPRVVRGVIVAREAQEGDGTAGVFEALAEGDGNGRLAAKGGGSGDEERGHSLMNYSTSTLSQRLLQGCVGQPLGFGHRLAHQLTANSTRPRRQGRVLAEGIEAEVGETEHVG